MKASSFAADCVLITGNMASGKSTVAQALAERLPRIGLWLDNSDLKVPETVDRIMQNLSLAVV